MADYEVSASHVNWHHLDQEEDDDDTPLASPSQKQQSASTLLHDHSSAAQPTAPSDAESEHTLRHFDSSKESTSDHGNGTSGKTKRLMSVSSSAAGGSEMSDHDDTPDDINTIVAPDVVPFTHPPSPYATCSFWSMVTFHWVNEIIRLGSRKPLDLNDMYALLPEENSQLRLNQLEETMRREEIRAAQKINTESNSPPTATTIPRPRLNLWLVLFKLFGPPYLKRQLLQLLIMAGKIVQPLMLYQLVQFVSDPTEPAFHGYLYAIAMCLGALLMSFVHHTYFLGAIRTGFNMRIALNAIIYKKVLSLKTTQMMKTTTGHLINLVSNDSSRVDDLMMYGPTIWTTLFECIIVIVILYREIGVAVFAGFAVILCLTVMQMYFSKFFTRYRRVTISQTDARVKTINEILIAADVMKMMNWESSLEAKVNQVRHDEFASITHASVLKSVNQAIFFASMTFVGMVCFITQWLRGVTFTPAQVFLTISLFNVIKLPLTNLIPLAVEKISETRIAFQRIQKFLELDREEEREYQQEDSETTKRLKAVKKQVEINNDAMRTRSSVNDPPQIGSITFEAASFVWEMNSDTQMPESEDNIEKTTSSTPSSPTWKTRQGLQHLDVSIRPGTLVGVIGSIGSYKSSFLAACLGEMTQIHGGQLIQGRLSYASQTAWIFAGTIRENILFGRPFDAQRYLRTIRSCQLVDDIKMCPYGDQTQIGEKGVNLSGGQRARLSCARAVYSDADIYLFDDPLAALDAVVARKLYDSVMSNGGMLAGKTRILVTHQTHLLTHAYIIMLDHGRIACQGSFDHLVQAGFLREEQKYATHDNDSSMEAADVKRRKKETRRKREKQREEKKRAALNNAGEVTVSTTQPGASQVDKNAIMRSETSVVGNLDPMVFIKLFRAGGGVPVAVIVLILIILGQVISIYADKWLANWSGMSAEDQKDDLNVWIFLGLVGGTIIFGLARSRAFYVFILRAAASLHESMFHAVIYSPMRFFESNPVGRIMNRFSKDQSIVDEMFPFNFFDLIQCLFIVLGSLVVVGISAPFVLIIVIPIIPLFVWVRQRFLATNRELKRLDATTRSPVYALFSSTLSGLITIRSFRSEDAFVENFLSKMDENTRPYFMVLASVRWFAMRLEVLSIAIVLCLGLLIAGTRDTISPANAGFALSYGLMLTSFFQWAVRQSAEVEAMMTAVERVCEYSELKHEGELINPDYRPAPGWPSQGVIEFKDYKMRYRPGLDLVLKGVNLRIAPGEKVGVCGRTGAGKSSLFQALLRLVEADSGSIEIDDMEIGKLGLSDLRSNLAIIPQYPVIFSGSLRYNLDPFSRCSDAEIWSALESVQLAKMVQGLKDQLLEEMAEFGTNFSVGECQLICVARALLKPSKVLCVDEATANVDSKTDQLIQTVIREKFKDRTVLTIAHRLNTILDCDRIVVMAAGRVAEFGSPAELLARPPVDLITEPDATYGLFAFMAQQKKAAQ